MNKFILYLIISASSLWCESLPNQKTNVQDSEEVNAYHITFNGLNSRSISVKARIQVDENEFYILPHDKRFLPVIESWWDVITIESMSDDSKDPLEIIEFIKTKEFNITKAQLNREVVGTLELTYTVDISYIDKNYPNLNTAIGKSFGIDYFVVAKPLFIFSNYRSETKVTISHPAGLKITVPWKKQDESYISNSLREFAYSNIILTSGPMKTTDIVVSNLSYSIASFLNNQESAKLIKEMAIDISNYYVDLFPLDKPVRYVQLIYSVPGRDSGGEAYPYSSTCAFSEESMNTSISWKITVFHELFHMWNSHRLNGVTQNRKMEWLTEGFTEFMTEKALHKNGHINENQLTSLHEARLLRLKNTMIRKNGKVSILNSGEDKGPNYNIVYEGGWLIANWLNNEFKQKTINQWDFERFLAYLFDKYPEDGDLTLTVEAFLSEVGAINKETEKKLIILLNASDWESVKKFI